MARFFDKQLSLIILIFLMPLFFLPKINLLTVGSETAGLRIDDLFLLFFGTLLIWAHLLLDKRLYMIEIWVLILTLFGILSFASNRFLISLGYHFLDAKIFYAIRLLEYFLFFYIGTLAFRFHLSKGFIQAFFLWNFFLMTLQKLNLAGAITNLGYEKDVSARVQGIASFPSEMGLLLNLLFCYMIYDDSYRSKIIQIFPPYYRYFLRKSYLYILFIVIGIFVIFTGNRISLLAHLICFLGKLKQEINWKSIGSFVSLTIAFPLLMGIIIYMVIQTDSIYSRSASLLSIKNIHLAQIVWDKIDLTQDPISKKLIETDEYDMSWWLRIHKWIFVTKAFVNHPEVYLQGLGPGFAWSALDGGILRIIVEYGLIGSLLFFNFFRSIYKINQQMKWMTISLLINMIFFDAHLAYKTMSFYLFAAGYCFESKHNHSLTASSTRANQLKPELIFFS
ncbi:hypothetical protein [Candidatus Protochlamydia sp. R18]|uniref:hypothetical protein n=1 Tax=Candidatus Protochlamydia sp. R18 TaxID=1353977 RepID=UPI000693798A|nr:hypothetical protein [Candidatus Protochlamydia sp. R18]